MAAAVVVVAAIAVGGIAYASIPDATGTIHGCFKTTNGQLRVIDEGQSCRKNEAALNWSQTGPPGPPGLPGTFTVSADLLGNLYRNFPHVLGVTKLGNGKVQRPVRPGRE
jgi:hypothetical protein